MKLSLGFLYPLLFLTIVSAQEIRKIELLTYRFQSYRGFCGMNEGVTVELSNPDGNQCRVQQSGDFDGGDILAWGENQLGLGNCRDFPINENTMVYLNSNLDDDYCPHVVFIVKTNGQRFESKMEEERYDMSSNHIGHPVIMKGISRIVMAMAECDDDLSTCEGRDISIRIQTGSRHCIVKKKPTVLSGQLVVWGRDELLDGCSNIPVKENTFVWLKTDAWNDPFLPADMEIYMDDFINTNWRVRLGARKFNTFEKTNERNTNNKRLTVSQTWPRDEYRQIQRDRPLTCPNNTENACPVSEMHSYRRRAGDLRINCIFECPFISSTPFHTNLDMTDGTGHRCLHVGHDSKQYDWCCRTKYVSTSIPHCETVLNPNERPRVMSRPSNAQCINKGCPVNMVEGRQKNGPKVSVSCNPGCPKVYNHTQLDCSEVSRKIPAKEFCCNDPNADTALPKCSDLDNGNINTGHPGRSDSSDGGQPEGSGANDGGQSGDSDEGDGCISIIQNQDHPQYQRCLEYYQSLENNSNSN